MSELNILKLSIEDFLTLRMLKLVFIPICIILFIFSISFYFIADYQLDSLQNISYFSHEKVVDENNNISERFIYEGNGEGLFASIIKYIVSSSIFYFLVYSLGFILIVFLSNFVSLVILGFMSPFILEIIRKKHYPEIIFNGYGSILNSIFELIKSILLYILISVLLIPLYFVPMINIFAMSFPFYYLFHRLLIFDISSTVSSSVESKRIYYINRNNLRFKTLLFYISTLIPFFSIFITLFFIIYLGHTYINMKINENQV